MHSDDIAAAAEDAVVAAVNSPMTTAAPTARSAVFATATTAGTTTAAMDSKSPDQPRISWRRGSLLPAPPASAAETELPRPDPDGLLLRASGRVSRSPHSSGWRRRPASSSSSGAEKAFVAKMLLLLSFVGFFFGNTLKLNTIFVQG